MRISAMPEVVTIAEVLAHRAATSPEAVAFTDSQQTVTFGQLASAADRLGQGLARAGVARGDRVALFVPPGADFVRAFFALQRLGASPCAFDPSMPVAAAARRAARLQPRLALVAGPTGESLAATMAEAQLVCRELNAVTGDGMALPPPAGAPGDVAFLQPTSGTSGEPRAVMVTQLNVLASLRAAREMFGFGPHDVLVSWVPPWHDLGLMRFVLGPVFFGAPCHLVQPAVRNIPLWLRTITRVRGTVTGAPDFAYRLAARLVDPRGIDLSSLRLATDGGEPVRLTTIRAFERRFGVPGVIRPGYGLAEATLGVAGLRPGEPLRADRRGNLSCGRPLPGVEVRIAVEPDRAGEILVRGPCVFAGYFDSEEATAETLCGGWLHTGDVGHVDGDGHLYVLGRRRALLKRGGVPLAPRELEEIAERVPGVRLAAAVELAPAPASFREEIVVAVEADPGVGSPPQVLATAVAAAIRASLGFAPDRVVVLSCRSVPRTANGKIRYWALRDQLANGGLERRGAILFNSPSPGG